jgi:CheY-like chemotaxis protein
MATFGKRVQPKHRATPGDRKRMAPPAPRPGTHAAPTTPAPDTAVPDPAVPDTAPPDTAPPDTGAPAGPAPIPAPPSTPAAPELQAEPSVQLPAAPVSVSEPEPLPAAPGPLRVLVVDDNEDVRGLLRIAFARNNIEVVGAAGDFRQALAIAGQDQPGLILLDVNLPEVAGLDLLPQLREQCPRARVVMFSAQIGPQVIEQARQRGAVGFVEKGVSMKNVVAHLQEVAAAAEGEVVEPFPLRVYP